MVLSWFAFKPGANCSSVRNVVTLHMFAKRVHRYHDVSKSIDRFWYEDVIFFPDGKVVTVFFGIAGLDRSGIDVYDPGTRMATNQSWKPGFHLSMLIRTCIFKKLHPIA